MLSTISDKTCTKSPMHQALTDIGADMSCIWIVYVYARQYNAKAIPASFA